MSSKKTKSDLLVKTRFLNPIPAPACPPQTIEIPTDLARMGKADLTSAYAASLPMPMMVDSEIGMPLDLNACAGIWWDEVDSEFNPLKPVPIDSLHPDDAELLEMPDIVLGAGGSGTQHQLPGTAGRPRIRVEETWLRGTTYMGKNDGSKAPTIARVTETQEIEVPDASMLSQLQAIERSFWQHEQFTDESIKNLRHPTKKGVTAVDAFDVLPDEDVWSGHYNQINFPERPTDKESNKITNEQLLASIFRPRQDPIKGFQSYAPMEVPDYFSPKEHFTVEDLFNFSNLHDDDHHLNGPVDNGNASAVNGDVADPPTLTTGESYSSSLSSYGHHFSPDFPEPCEEVAELEWLSNFMEDCFSNKDHQQCFSFSSSNPAQIPTMPSVPAKTRSKRSRANRTNWASRRLPILPHQPEPLAVPVQVLPQPDSSEGEAVVRRCLHCGSDKTPQWRMGPMGPKTLCNACGVRYKSGRLVPEYRPAASPTFVVSEHSNSHRKVVELRRQKEMEQKKMMYWSSDN